MSWSSKAARQGPGPPAMGKGKGRETKRGGKKGLNFSVLKKRYVENIPLNECVLLHCTLHFACLMYFLDKGSIYS